MLYLSPRPPFKDNHVKKLRAMLARGELKMKPGALSHLMIAHDDWCAIFKGGVCNCDPYIWVEPPAGRQARRN